MQPFVGEDGKDKTLYICFMGHPKGYLIRSLTADTLFNHRYSSTPYPPPLPLPLPPPCLHLHDLDEDDWYDIIAYLNTKRRMRSSSSGGSGSGSGGDQTLPPPPPPPPPPLKEVWSYMYDDDAKALPPFGMGCCVKKKKIYLVGGAYTDFNDNNPDSMANIGIMTSNEEFSKHVYVYDVEAETTTHSLDKSSIKDMISPKSNSMVVSVGEKIYVLAGIGSHNHPDPAFEAYTPSSNSWEILESPPPPLDPVQSHGYLGYAVIGSSIYVSGWYDSFKFDTIRKCWEPCFLFDDHFIRSRPRPTPRRSSNSNGGSPPFPFTDQAVLFGDDDDTLICCVSHQVVAYLMADDDDVKGGGKVVQGSQTLFKLPEHTYSSCFADFGNGFFCIVVTDKDEDYLHYTNSYFISVIPFRLTKMSMMKKGLELYQDEFLLCEVANELNYTPQLPVLDPDITWLPIATLVS